MHKKEFKVLIAEDDEIVRDVIYRFLSDEGYPVVVATDGIAAIKLLRLEDVKLVLTDLRMPGADGMEVLRSAMHMDPRIAVVLLTAYGTLDTALEAMKEGAYDYIVKPFVMQQLLLVVRNAYRMASLMEENDKLSTHLKETYRHLEALRKSGGSERTNIPGHSGGGMEPLKGHDITDSRETGNINGNMKRFSSLVDNLKDK